MNTPCVITVIDRVLKKSHTFNGATLMVIETKPLPPRPVDLRRIFLKEVPEDVDRDSLMIFVENRTGIGEEPSVIFGEKSGTVMLYYDHEITSMWGFLIKILLIYMRC